MQKAYLNHSRWIVNCPNCPNAFFATGEEITCNECNTEFKHELPKIKDKVEEAVRVRPPEHRNWTPGETLALLREENKEHGVAMAYLDREGE
jgi:hypothetical protein